MADRGVLGDGFQITVSPQTAARKAFHDADFMRPLGHRVSGHAVNSNDGEQQGGDRKRSKQEEVEAAGSNRVGQRLFQGLYFECGLRLVNI
jgi:hypothetical protein